MGELESLDQCLHIMWMLQISASNYWSIFRVGGLELEGASALGPQESGHYLSCAVVICIRAYKRSRNLLIAQYSYVSLF